MDNVDELLDRADNLPPAPKLLPQLLSALDDVNSDMNQVVDLITFDPALTAKVIQVCNSATFGFSIRVDDVASAVNRLGFHGVYHIAAVVCGSDFLKPSGASTLDANRLWRHAVGTAFAAKSVAGRVDADENLLFTAGLLHDIGKVPLSEVLQGDYDALITDANLAGRALVELESASFGLDHAEVGARLIESWEFSPEFAAAIRFHHNPGPAADVARVAAALELADYLAHSLEPDNPFTASLDPDPALAILGLAPSDLESFRDSAEENLRFVQMLCQVA